MAETNGNGNGGRWGSSVPIPYWALPVMLLGSGGGIGVMADRVLGVEPAVATAAVPAPSPSIDEVQSLRSRISALERTVMEHKFAVDRLSSDNTALVSGLEDVALKVSAVGDTLLTICAGTPSLKCS